MEIDDIEPGNREEWHKILAKLEDEKKAKSAYRPPRDPTPPSIPPQKLFVEANALYSYSFELGEKIFNSGWRPNWIVALWRGGCPTGMCIQELFKVLDIKTDHIACRTSSYIGQDQSKIIQVHGLEYITKNVKNTDKLLIVDDVFDTGRSVQAVIEKLKIKTRSNFPQELRIASVFWKKGKNLTSPKIIPDYYNEIVDDKTWIVFPHEIEGLKQSEIDVHIGSTGTLIRSFREDKKEKEKEAMTRLTEVD
jgi:uncharacterized protein